MNPVLKEIWLLNMRKNFSRYVLLGIVVALSGFLFTLLVNKVVSVMIHDGSANDVTYFTAIFAIVIIAMVSTKQVLSLGIIKLSQSIFWSFRKQLIFSVFKADYRQLTKSKTNISSAISSDVITLTNASVIIIDFFVACIISLVCLVYTLYISPGLFGLTIVFTALGAFIYFLKFKRNKEDFIKAHELENGFLKYFNSILDGYKEIRIESRKGQSIYNNKIKSIVNETYACNVKAYTGFLNNQIIGQILSYILIVSVLLYFSPLLHIRIEQTISFIFVLLYLLNAVEKIFTLIPTLTQAKIAWSKLDDLMNELKRFKEEDRAQENKMLVADQEFQTLRIEKLQFDFRMDEKSFGIGPIDLNVERGDVIFIFGGNGSGKTTFFNCILGLYRLTGGEISVNNVRVDDDDRYKVLFSPVFNDFHLFTDLSWIENFDISKWNYYIKLFELEDKVLIENKCISAVNLSTGQKKRLALINSIMENKPILVLDEWAADQDPYFRRKFYLEIIPVLKGNLITVIAITHDDKYYDTADKLFKMDYGKLVEVVAETYMS